MATSTLLMMCNWQSKTSPPPVLLCSSPPPQQLRFTLFLFPTLSMTPPSAVSGVTTYFMINMLALSAISTPPQLHQMPQSTFSSGVSTASSFPTLDQLSACPLPQTTKDSKWTQPPTSSTSVMAFSPLLEENVDNAAHTASITMDNALPAALLPPTTMEVPVLHAPLVRSGMELHVLLDPPFLQPPLLLPLPLSPAQLVPGGITSNWDVYPAQLDALVAPIATIAIPAVLASTNLQAVISAPRCVVMAWNSFSVVMMETLSVVTDVAGPVRLNLASLVLEDHPHLRILVVEAFLQLWKSAQPDNLEYGARWLSMSDLIICLKLWSTAPPTAQTDATTFLQSTLSAVIVQPSLSLPNTFPPPDIPSQLRSTSPRSLLACLSSMSAWGSRLPASTSQTWTPPNSSLSMSTPPTSQFRVPTTSSEVILDLSL